MIKYNCKIDEFRNFDPPNPPSLDGKEYRMQIKVSPQEKINQPDIKQHQENYRIDIVCSKTLVDPWGLSNNDLEKVIYEYTRQHFIEQFREGNLAKSTKLNLPMRNTPLKCLYDPEKIHYSLNYTFEVEVTPKIGFSDNHK